VQMGRRSAWTVAWLGLAMGSSIGGEEDAMVDGRTAIVEAATGSDEIRTRERR